MGARYIIRAARRTTSRSVYEPIARRLLRHGRRKSSRKVKYRKHGPLERDQAHGAIRRLGRVYGIPRGLAQIYTASSWPARMVESHGAHYANPPGTLHLGHLKQEGHGFRTGNAWDTCSAADDENFGPVAADVGRPDGAIWMSDFSSVFIQHNQNSEQAVAASTPAQGAGMPFVKRAARRSGRALARGVHARPRRRNMAVSSRPERPARSLAKRQTAWRMHAQRLLVEARRPGRGAA